MSSKRTKSGRRSSRKSFLRQYCEFIPADLPFMQGANVRWGLGYYDGVLSGIMVWRRKHYAFFLWRDSLDGLRPIDLLNTPRRIFVAVDLSPYELECACKSQSIAISSGRDHNRYEWKPNRRSKSATFPECINKLSNNDYRKLVKPFNDVVRNAEKNPKVGWFWR